MSEPRTKYGMLERLTSPALIVIAGTVLYLRRKPIMILQGQSQEFCDKGYVHKSPLEMALLNYH
jgi:hypothetical protein